MEILFMIIKIKLDENNKIFFFLMMNQHRFTKKFYPLNHFN